MIPLNLFESLHAMGFQTEAAGLMSFPGTVNYFSFRPNAQGRGPLALGGGASV
jgi:hypothetical protein